MFHREGMEEIRRASQRDSRCSANLRNIRPDENDMEAQHGAPNSLPARPATFRARSPAVKDCTRHLQRVLFRPCPFR